MATNIDCHAERRMYLSVNGAQRNFYSLVTRKRRQNSPCVKVIIVWGERKKIIKLTKTRRQLIQC